MHYIELSKTVEKIPEYLSEIEFWVMLIRASDSLRQGDCVKTTHKIITLLFILFWSATIAFANGGIRWYWNATGTPPAQITLKNDADISLKKENLTLRFVDDSVIVDCDYILYNKSNATKQIEFAFNITDSSNDSLIYYSIYLNGEKIPSNFHRETSWDEIESVYKFWELSKLTLASKKESKVSVTYRVQTSNDGMHYANKFNDNSFIYNLYPALSFGNGIIEDFNITVDVSDILSWGGKVKKIEGVDLGFKDSDRIISRHYSNFDLNKNRQLKITYNIKNWYFKDLLERYPAYPAIRADTELTEGKTLYAASNMSDYNCDTAWVEGKSDFGKGQRIKISVKGWITQVLLVNGFRKTEKTFYENNRIKRIALYVDGKKLGEMEFPDRKYCRVDMTNILDEGELLNLGNFFTDENLGKTLQSGRTFAPESDIEIEILDVYRGTKYNDTCVSDIYVIKAQIPIP